MSDLRKFVRVGSFFAACAAILSATFVTISYAKPLIDSDWPGPFAGQRRVEECDAKVQQLAQNFTLMQMHQQRSDINQAFLARGFWQGQLAMAQERVRRHPDDMLARQAVLNAQAQIDEINRLIASTPRP